MAVKSLQKPTENAIIIYKRDEEREKLVSELSRSRDCVVYEVKVPIEHEGHDDLKQIFQFHEEKILEFIANL